MFSDGGPEHHGSEKLPHVNPCKTIFSHHKFSHLKLYLVITNICAQDKYLFAKITEHIEPQFIPKNIKLQQQIFMGTKLSTKECFLETPYTCDMACDVLCDIY